MLIEDFIVAVYCEVCQGLKTLLPDRLRQRGFAPALSDAEVLTMEFTAAYLRLGTDKAIWEYFNRHWRQWFPALGSRSNFVRQSANLWQVKQLLHRHWVDRLGASHAHVHVVDGFPIPVCHFRRAYFSEVFRGEAAYGYCASKQETYYGFKGLLLTTAQGVIEDIAVVPANLDERDALGDLRLDSLSGLLLGDKGFIRPQLKEDLAQQGLDLQTPLRGNMKEVRAPGFLRWMMRTRRIVETTIGQLADRFEIEKTRARKLWQLTSRIYRKVAAHTLCVLLNRQLGRPLLQLDGLIAG